MAQHLKGRPEIKRIAVIAPDYEFGQHFAADFLAHLKVARPDIAVVRQEWPKLGATDFAPHVTALQAQPVDMVVGGVGGGGGLGGGGLRGGTDDHRGRQAGRPSRRWRTFSHGAGWWWVGRANGDREGAG